MKLLVTFAAFLAFCWFSFNTVKRNEAVALKQQLAEATKRVEELLAAKEDEISAKEKAQRQVVQLNKDINKALIVCPQLTTILEREAEEVEEDCETDPITEDVSTEIVQ
jgi:hypothetical protein